MEENKVMDSAQEYVEVGDIDYFVITEIERQTNKAIVDMEEGELEDIMSRSILYVKQPLAIGKKPKYSLRIKHK